MARYIINDKWYAEKKTNVEDGAERIVTAAAKIIRAEIRVREYDSSSYPTNQDITNFDQSRQWVPHYLQKFLEIIISSKVK